MKKVNPNANPVLRKTYLKILDFAKAQGGRIVIGDPALNDVLGKGVNRLPTSISDMRNHMDIVAERKGRVVVAYVFPDLIPTASTPSDAADEPVQNADAMTATV